MDNLTLAVNINNLSHYWIKNSNETEEDLLNRIAECNKQDKERYYSIIEHYPENDEDGFYTNSIAEIESADYKIMSSEEFMQLKRKHYLDGKITEITEEDYNNALDILPPLQWCTIDGIEMFCMSEMIEYTYTTQYAYNKIDGKYYCMIVDTTDKTTWINNYLNK